MLAATTTNLSPVFAARHFLPGDTLFPPAWQCFPPQYIPGSDITYQLVQHVAALEILLLIDSYLPEPYLQLFEGRHFRHSSGGKAMEIRRRANLDSWLISSSHTQ